MSGSGEVFAKFGQTVVRWSPDHRWPLVRLEAVDPLVDSRGPVEFLHWSATETRQSANAYAKRAFGARFSSLSTVTYLDVDAFNRAVDAARDLYRERLITKPMLALKRRMTYSSLNPDVALYRDESGLVIVGRYRVGVLDWATIERMESHRPGSTFAVLTAMLPGRHLLTTEAEFYQFLGRWNLWRSE
jgi:hypothetical protein